MLKEVRNSKNLKMVRHIKTHKKQGILIFDATDGRTYKSGKRKIKKAERKMMKKIKQRLNAKNLEIMESLEQ